MGLGLLLLQGRFRRPQVKRIRFIPLNPPLFCLQNSGGFLFDFTQSKGKKYLAHITTYYKRIRAHLYTKLEGILP